jgi:hypothetical protein
LVWVVTAWTVVAITLGAVGCGKKADPQPPLVRRADTTRDLAAYQDANEVVLDWGYPSMTTAGGPLPDLELIEVWRAPIPLGQEPEGTTAGDRAMRIRLFEAQGERIASLDDAARDRATRGSRLVYRDDLEAWRKIHGAEQQVVLWYAVRTTCCGGRASDFSNIARLVPQLPPSPPESLRATPGPSGIRLGWRGSGDATTLVERSPDGQSWSAVAAEPVPGTEYLDATAGQGATWSYRVRSVRRREGEGRVVGDPGPVVTVDYPDVYPPEPPRDLVCLPEERRVVVRWRGVPAAVSYRVGRLRGDRMVQLVEAHPETSFDDDDAPVGDLIYSVSAVDAAGNVSEPVTCSATLGTAP